MDPSFQQLDYRVYRLEQLLLFSDFEQFKRIDDNTVVIKVERHRSEHEPESFQPGVETSPASGVNANLHETMPRNPCTFFNIAEGDEEEAPSPTSMLIHNDDPHVLMPSNLQGHNEQVGLQPQQH